VTKTQSAGPISCLEHCATRILHHTIVTGAAAVLMFPVYSRRHHQSDEAAEFEGLIQSPFTIWPGNGVGLF